MDSWSVLETLPGTDEDCSDGSTELASWRRTAVMVGRSRSQILEEPRAPWCARRWVALAAIVAFAALLYLLRPLPVYGGCCVVATPGVGLGVGIGAYYLRYGPVEFSETFRTRSARRFEVEEEEADDELSEAPPGPVDGEAPLPPPAEPEVENVEGLRLEKCAEASAES